MATTAQRSNLEIVESAYEAFNAGDTETLLATFDEDVEWVEPEGGRYAGTYRGHEAVSGVFGRIAEDFETFEVVPDRYVDGGDSIVAIGTTTGTVRESGTRIEIPFAHCCDMRDGKLVRFEEFADTETFNRAF